MLLHPSPRWLQHAPELSALRAPCFCVRSADCVGIATKSAPLTIGTIDRRRRYNYKLLISLQSHPATEANLDFSFVTAVLGVFSTNLPMGRLGSREALDWCAARI
ncbi:hypothetical protein, partial [Rhizobium leguminosarum]|uniref:hypothetical protein n=1 Tax=Rhizobium leguminosarum TaxID=384 RepID=UPI001A8E69DB